MLPRLILLLLQLGLGWMAAPQIAKHVPNLGGLNIFIYAVIFAVLVVIVGFIGSLVLKEVGPPSSATMTTTLVVALVFAALTLLQPLVGWISSVTQGQIPVLAYPLVGAVLGYFARK